MSIKKSVICTTILILLFPALSSAYTVLGRFHEQIASPYGPGGLAYDETTDSLWASDIVEKKIRKIDPSTGGVLTTLDVGYNELPLGLTYRNSYLWNSDQWALPDGFIHQVDPANGTSVTSITGLGGLTFDHLGRLWSTNWDVELRALDPADGSILDTITLPGFDPNFDQTLGLAFDEGTQTLWVSVVDNRWGGGTLTNLLINVGLDGTVLSTEVFDPDPTLVDYELVGLAFDNNNDILWATYSLFDRPPTSDDTYIYKLSTASICNCELVPDATVIHRGETLGFQASVTNNTGGMGTVLFGTKVTKPDASQTGFIWGPIQVYLNPHQTKSGHKTHTIPVGFALGTYTYHGYVGRFGNIYDECQFDFEVIEVIDPGGESCTGCHELP